MSTAKLIVKDLYKIFGNEPQQAYQLLSENLSKEEIFIKTGQTVGVKKASFEIQSGEIFVIMGLSGSGKSTLVRLLNRLIEPTSGQVILDDEDVALMSAHDLRELRRSKMSMVFQSFALMPHMNVIDNVALGLELSGVKLKQRHQRALDALKQVGLDANAESYPDELSGGMQQRVGLARALAVDPDILLMDEAFSALDPLIRSEMQDELLTLQSQHARTIVFISHDLDEAMRIGDRIAIMQDGVVVQVGTPDEILHSPANDYVKSFFKGVNVSQVYTAGYVADKQQAAVVNKEASANPHSALTQLQDQHRDYGFVVDDANSFVGVVSVDSLNKSIQQHKTLDDALLDGPASLDADTAVHKVIGEVAQAPCEVPVVNADNEYLGVISKKALLQTLSQEEQR